MVSGRPGVVRYLTAAVTVGLIAGCSSGIGRDPELPRATIRAYETRVSELQGQVDAQRPTIEALARTPAAPTEAAPTPVPYAAGWTVVQAGSVETRNQAGVRDGLTPVAANGVFLVVPITVTNTSEVPRYFNPVGEFVAVDDLDRRFDVDAAATSAVYVVDFGLDPGVGSRQPGIAYPDVLVFDVPPDATGFQVESFDASIAFGLDQ